MTTLEANVYWLSKQGKGIYLFFGGSTGMLTSPEFGHNVIKTLILGAAGALGGALVKLLIDLIAKGIDKKVKLTKWEKDHYDMLKRKEQEELLLKREEELTKNNL
jgi:hypothetical protein